MSTEALSSLFNKLRRLISHSESAIPEVETDPIEQAKLLGKRFNLIWGGGPDKTPFSEFDTVLRYPRVDLLTEVANGTSSRLVVFVASITQKDKNLISSSVWPIQRAIKAEGIKEPTLENFREQVQRLNLRFTIGEPVSVSRVNFGARRMAFLIPGFQK